MSDELFWDLADEMRAADSALSEGTIMSSRCLRLNGDFLAMPHHKRDGLVVKLPASRVAELVASGTGEPFAPAGRVFKKWVAIPKLDEELWRSLLTESKAFVGP